MVIAASLAFALAALVQTGYPTQDTMLDCRLTPVAGQPSSSAAGAVEMRRVAVFLRAGGQRTEEARSYEIKGIDALQESARTSYSWPRHFLIEENAMLRGIHGEQLGQGTNSLSIERIDARRRQAELTLITHQQYDNGRTIHEAATGPCRLIEGVAASHAFEEFAV